MTDYRNYIDVVRENSSLAGTGGRGRWLLLKCGHEVYRYSKVAPKKVKCERCLNPPSMKGERA